VAATMSLLGYRLGSALTSLEPVQHRSMGVIYAEPAPSEIPESVALKFDSSTRIGFEFQYSDHEPPESADRLVDEGRAVSVRLGDRTKKILRLLFEGDINSHLADRFAFDESVVVRSGALNPRSTVSFRRSAAIIREILAQPSLSKQINERLHEVNELHPASVLDSHR